jgi:hypothetical protein
VVERLYDWCMFEDVVTALRERPLPVDRDVVLELLAVVDAAAVALNDALDGFDEAGLWRDEHAPSLLAWLKTLGRRSPADAARVCRRMARVRSMPHVHAAWLAGRLSSGHVDAVVRNVSGRTAALFAEGEAERVDTMTRLSVEHTAALMRHWAAAARDRLQPDPADGEPADDVEPGEVWASKTLDGRMVLNGDLDPETAETVETALRLADSGDTAMSAAQRRCEALGALCQSFLDHNQKPAAEPKPGRRAARPHLNLIVRPDGKGETEDGVPVPKSMIERLACDAIVNVVGVDEHGNVLFYGRDRRTATDAQYRALVVRDRGCRFPDCHRPAWWCDAHHVNWWEHGGPTDIDNLVLLCRHHHSVLHRERCDTKLLPDGTYEVTFPDGHTKRSRPPDDPKLRRLFEP